MTITNGKKFYSLAIRSRKDSNKILSDSQADINRLNNIIDKKASTEYMKFLSDLEKDKDNRLANKNSNIAKINIFLNKTEEKVFNPYKKKYSKVSNSTVRDVLKQEKNFIKSRNNLFGLENKTIITKDLNARLSNLNKASFQRINQTIKKWHDFAYGVFLRGITQQQTIDKIIEQLLTQFGSIRIGSSFGQSTEAEMIINAVSQRTAFVMEDAKKQNLKCCWNGNPIDRRTKPICLEASIAGVIPEKQMLDTYGPPPRYICRCDLVYTRCEWSDINTGINQTIEERRIKLIDILKSDPDSYQKSSWFANINGEKKRIIPNDPTRAAGKLLYKNMEEMIGLLESNPVDEYEIPNPESI